MKPTIRRHIPRPDRDIVRALPAHGVATIHESMHRLGLLDPRMRPISPGWSIAGPAVTSLNHPGDNLMVHAALAVCEPGDVLVVATTSASPYGMIGELIARQAKVRGLAGIIIDSGVRDVAELRQLGLPVWSSTISAAGTAKATPGWVNVPMVCAGVMVNPGDIVVADDDGVVIVPREDAAMVLGASQERTAREARSRERIDTGVLSFDSSNLREYLSNHGVTIDE